MFLDRHNYVFFKEEAKKYQKEIECMFNEAVGYLSDGFHGDIEVLTGYFEGRTPIDYAKFKEIESRFMNYFFKTMEFDELIENPLFQLCMAIKMGFTKTGGIITFPEICELEGISKQQLHRSTYNILDDPPEEDKKHKMPAVKMHGKSFVFLRDFYYWQATRIRRKK